MNGVDVYECSEANQATNIKNLLEYSQGYSKSQGTNEFFYIDTKRNAEEGSAHANYNSGFAARKLLLNAGSTVNAEIPLNRYGFLKSLHGELLPNSKIELKIDLESDANLVWQAADNCRVVLSKFQLIVPSIVFNADGKSLYISTYLDTRKWTYLRELVERGNLTQQQTANFCISTGINKPRHVFVYIINDANLESQTANKFWYNTFNVTDDKALNSCYLEVGNGKEYPEVHYKPSTEPNRVFRDVLKYVYADSDYAGDTLINRSNFGTIFPFIYFDLTKQTTDIKDDMTKLTFKYTLSGNTNAAHSVYALVLSEQDMADLGVLAKIVITRLYGHLWSGSLQQNVVLCLHFKCILIRRWWHLRQGVFEAPIVGLLFWAFSLGPPLAKSQKMADLGVLANIVITRLYGHLWSAVCSKILSYVCTSSAYQLGDDGICTRVFLKPQYAAYIFEHFPLVPPWQNLRKWPI